MRSSAVSMICFGLPPQHLEHRHAFGAFLVEDLLEHRGFHDAETDPQPDADHDGAEEERDAPAPDQELIAGKPTEEQHRAVRQEQSAGAPNCGHAERKPRFLLVRAPTPSATEPPHSPPTPMPWIRRIVSRIAPQMPMLS